MWASKKKKKKERKMWASVLSELSLSDVASWFNASTISSLNLHNSEGWACIVYIEQSEAQSQKKIPQGFPVPETV